MYWPVLKNRATWSYVWPGHGTVCTVFHSLEMSGLAHAALSARASAFAHCRYTQWLPAASMNSPFESTMYGLYLPSNASGVDGSSFWPYSAARRVVHHVVGHRRAALRPDLDDAGRGARPVQRRGRRALHHLDALDVQGVQVHQARAQDHPVHDVERVLATAAGVDARRAPQQDVLVRARTARAAHHRDALPPCRRATVISTV